MTNEEYTHTPAEGASGLPAATARTYEVFETTMNNFMATADQSRVIGEPIQHGDQLIIPTAEVTAVAGFGVGTGPGPRGEGNNMGTGGAGGGNTFSRPVAVIVAGPHDVQVLPVVDRTKIVLTALTAVGFMIATLARFQRGPRGE